MRSLYSPCIPFLALTTIRTPQVFVFDKYTGEGLDRENSKALPPFRVPKNLVDGANKKNEATARAKAVANAKGTKSYKLLWTHDKGYRAILRSTDESTILQPLETGAQQAAAQFVHGKRKRSGVAGGTTTTVGSPPQKVRRSLSGGGFGSASASASGLRSRPSQSPEYDVQPSRKKQRK
jgi:hypothetical protein